MNAPLIETDAEFGLSNFQQRLLLIPEQYDVFLGGGRGGAKSYAMAILAMRHVEQYGAKARVLYIRQTYKGLADFEAITRDIFGMAYAGKARFNGQEHVWRFPNGAYMELGQLEAINDYQKYQGRSFTLLMIDEAGQYAVPDLLDKLRSNLRGPKTIKIRAVVAANPGDAGHQWLAQRYVFKAAPWQPFYEDKSKRDWVYAPSTYTDNPFIDPEQYLAQLQAACPTDPDLLRAWVSGDWTVARGAYFAAVLSEDNNAVDPWQPENAQGLRNRGWHFYLAHDFGVSAPSVTFVCAESPGITGPDGRYYAKDSIVLLDELATADPNNLNQGMKYTVPRLAEEIRDLAKRWAMRPRGCADDAIFATTGHHAGSIAQEFSRCGVHFDRAKKADRLSGWERMRRMLDDANKLDVPGLYISRACSYFWATVPYLGRDPRKTDDVDSRGPDHAADACRYALLYRRHGFKSSEFTL